MNWKQYKRKGVSEMRPYMLGEDISRISISEADIQAGSPKGGDMIARNPRNHTGQWLVARKYFEDNFELVRGKEISGNNTNEFLTADQIPIGSWWEAADGSGYGYCVISVDTVKGEATVLSSSGETREIDTFKLQYRYSLVCPNTLSKIQ
jgi:hypothetical protein